jgi:intracellular multiplication protein IcmC
LSISSIAWADPASTDSSLTASPTVAQPIVAGDDLSRVALGVDAKAPSQMILAQTDDSSASGADDGGGVLPTKTGGKGHGPALPPDRGDNPPSTPPPSTNAPDIWTFLKGILQSTIALQQLVMALSYTIGVGLMLKALVELKKVGEANRMGAQHGLRGPFIMVVVGIACLFFPNTLTVGLTTFFGDSSILAYPTTDSALTDQAMDVLIKIVQLVGIIAVLRGLLLFHKSATGQAEQKTMGRAFTHVIGGILCINIVATTDVVYSTLGIVTN